MELTVEILRNITLILHFIGIGALLGGFLTQMKAMRSRQAKIVPAMNHGAWTMFITGLILTGIAEYRASIIGFEVNHALIGAKTFVVVVILVLVLLNRKKPVVSPAVFGSIGLLTIANITMAVLY
ncbi:MAG TPA: hypothetical protein VIB61_03705 [Microbacteriaceae bacterium]